MKTRAIKNYRIDARKICTAVTAGIALLTTVGVSAQLAVNEDKFLGNIIAGSVPSSFSTYWNQVTPENNGKWEVVEPSRDSMNWSGLDTAYNFAQSNGYIFKQHTFVWGSQEPGWIGSLSEADQRAEVEEFMQLYCARYPATDFIDVVNEPLHAPASYRNALGGAGATGWDWVIWAFEKARQHCPDAQLLINDYGIINDSSAVARYKEIITQLQSRGLVDGIGIQSHTFNLIGYSASTLESNLDSLAQLGLPIYVSEWDVDADDQAQLEEYQTKFPVVWNHPAVKGVTLWGYIVGQTWRDNTGLLRADGTERPALQWLRQYFNDGTSSSSSSSSISSSSSSSQPSSASSSTSNGQQCNWYGTLYPLCSTTQSGWGWENNQSCVARSTCSSQPAPYGIVGGASSSSSSSVTSSSSAPSSAASSSSSTSSSGNTGGSCQYVVSNEWNNGFTGAIRITNNGNGAISNWSVSWSYSDGSAVTSGWNANITGSNPYTATNLSWNGTIQPGQTIEFGVQGTKGGSGNAQIPAITGSVCN